MDNRDKNFAKSHLYTALLECQEVEITPKELYKALTETKIGLVDYTLDTMFISPQKKKIDNLLFILDIMVKQLDIASVILHKHGYNVDTEQKLIKYVNSLLEKEGKNAITTR